MEVGTSKQSHKINCSTAGGTSPNERCKPSPASCLPLGNSARAPASDLICHRVPDWQQAHSRALQNTRTRAAILQRTQMLFLNSNEKRSNGCKCCRLDPGLQPTGYMAYWNRRRDTAHSSRKAEPPRPNLEDRTDVHAHPPLKVQAYAVMHIDRVSQESRRDVSHAPALARQSSMAVGLIVSSRLRQVKGRTQIS